jgi:L-ribulose-5-phosphate 3-epimerase
VPSNTSTHLTLPGRFDLRDKKVRKLYYQRSDETGVTIASLGMGVLNKFPLATYPEAIQWVADAIEVLAKMQKERPELAPRVCLLAFFGKGDINGEPDLMDAVAKKLKTIIRRAEDAGIVFGIESLMSANDHLKIIDAVGSTSLQVYYDTANSNRMGYDIYKEVVQLGSNRICEVHCKENGAHLGEGVIDFPRFKSCLDKIGYKDWLIIEGAMPKGAEVIPAYSKNFQYLKKLFRH